jgi:hypothetical protein
MPPHPYGYEGRHADDNKTDPLAQRHMTSIRVRSVALAARQCLRRTATRRGELPLDQALKYAAQIYDGVGYTKTVIKCRRDFIVDRQNLARMCAFSPFSDPRR